MIADDICIRMVVGVLSFNTTAGQIRSGVGATTSLNRAAQRALGALEECRADNSAVSGLNGRWEDYNIQMDIVA